ncbi:hypothetical protein BDP55DRAFT_671772 [Colletotrichum godetiae]|uniref:Secreted protein n=1 Tax=Colletotrichum godetiae TaxID=1209918 RepID=A0AAJ0AF69_9PEZI|nr:uncharacterized protein BDP55DRAFT_671772 [Colletotrichum godetiae]KAK1672783.1 hypothetical protein BDP55DRAFT_671772 [Colletotrichum godetiae]
MVWRWAVSRIVFFSLFLFELSPSPVPEALHHGGLGPDHGQEGGRWNVPPQILTMPGAENLEIRRWEGSPKAWAFDAGKTRRNRLRAPWENDFCFRSVVHPRTQTKNAIIEPR